MLGVMKENDELMVFEEIQQELLAQGIAFIKDFLPMLMKLVLAGLKIYMKVH